MIGYEDPTMGKKRRQALSEYLRQQSAQRSQNAGRMRGIGTTAFGSSSSGYGQPFLRGGRKATPEKFAFAGVKPSMKTLLGLVGQNMGNGGDLPFSLFGPDTPVGGLGWGGALPNPPQTPTAAPPMGGSPTQSVASNPYQAIQQQGEGGWMPTPSGTPPMQIPQMTQSPYNMDYHHLLAQFGLNGPIPILGSLKYEQLQ